MSSRISLAVLAVAACLGGTALAQSPSDQDSILPASPPRGAIIESQTLAPLDPWSVSGLARGERGLPRSLWRASDSDRIEALLDATPAAFVSPTAWALLRDALAAPADPPRAAGAADSRSSARKRVEALARLGAADEVAALSIGPLREDPSVIVFAAQADLARNRVNEACGRLNALGPEDGGAFGPRMRAICLAVDGQVDAALLALEIAAPRGADPWLGAALRALAGGGAPGPAGRQPALTGRYDTSLNATVSLLAALPAPREIDTASSSLFALRALASADATPIPVRAEASLRLLRLGRIDAGEARRALSAPIVPGARTLPLWASLIRDVEAASDPAAKASLLQRAIDTGTSATHPAVIYRLFGDELAALQRDGTAFPGSASFARAALAAGAVDSAMAWLRKADQTRSDPRQISILESALAVLGRLNDNQRQFVAERRAETGGPTAARDLRALAAFDLPLGAGAQAAISADAARPAGPTTAETQLTETRLGWILEAQRRGATGETALLASLLTADGAGKLNAGALSDVITALRGAGFDTYARALAVEALLAPAPVTPTPRRR